MRRVGGPGPLWGWVGRAAPGAGRYYFRRGGGPSGTKGVGGGAREQILLPAAGQLLEDEGVRLPLAAYRRLHHVPRQHDGLVGQRQQPLEDARHLFVVVAA